MPTILDFVKIQTELNSREFAAVESNFEMRMLIHSFSPGFKVTREVAETVLAMRDKGARQ